MWCNRDNLTAMAIVRRLHYARVGIIISGVRKIDPCGVARIVGDTAQIQGLHVVAVGYSRSEPGPGVTLALDVETGVSWRSDPRLAGRILVFTHGTVPKLHSLNDFDRVTPRNVAEEALTIARDKLSRNQIQQRFWDALKRQCAMFPLDRIEDFIRAVARDGDDHTAIPSHMWRLGLLRDDLVVDSNQDPAARIIRNREMILEMGVLSDSSRKRIAQVLARSAGEERDLLRTTFRTVMRYYRHGSTDLLRDLSIQTVETLIKAGRPLPRSVPQPDPASPGDTDTTDGNGPSDVGHDRPLSGSKLQREIAEKYLFGNDDDEKGLKAIGQALKKCLESPKSERTITVEDGFYGGTVLLDEPNRELLQLVGRLCSAKYWGGIVSTQATELEEAVRTFTEDQVMGYDPSDPGMGVAGQCLFSLLRTFDSYTEPETPSCDLFGPTLDALLSAREELLKHLDLLVLSPQVLFGGYSDARSALERYMSSYGKLLQLFRRNEPQLHGRDPDATRLAASELLRLDVVFVRAPNAMKAILTPLHPMHLWRYQSLLKATKLSTGSAELTEHDRRSLVDTFKDLPHPLHFVIIPDTMPGHGLALPQAGSLGSLPRYENSTNEYLGSDGIDSLEDLLKRWVSYSPYSRAQIRLALVDVPDVTEALDVISRFLESDEGSRVLVHCYYTSRRQLDTSNLGLRLQDDDYKTIELLRSGRLEPYTYAPMSIEAIADRLEQTPFHIVYLFDQSSYTIDLGPRAHRLTVSPLVVTYDYRYSETFRRGTISPSSESEEGIFGDYHFIIERAAKLPAGEQIRLTFDPGASLETVNALLSRKAARWLVIADRTLIAYCPNTAIPIGEYRSGQREIGVWAERSSRVLRDVECFLSNFNVQPDRQRMEDLLRRFGHIAAANLLHVLSAGKVAESRIAHLKGLVGTVLAAAWYEKYYSGAIVASLDSALAHSWLRSRSSSSERADLIGMRVTPDGTLVVEPIEVKTKLDQCDVRLEREPETGTRRLQGSAVDQVSSILAVLKPIFGGDDPQPLFTPARREVLKYQLYRECFREVHSYEWQRDWYHRLQKAFTCAPDGICVECRGAVIQVCLETNLPEAHVEDEAEPLLWVKLTTSSVQALVGSASTTSRAIVEQSPLPSSDLPTASRPEQRCWMEPELPIETPPDAQVAGCTAGTCGNSQIRSVVDEPEARDEQATELASSFKKACACRRVELAECDPERAVIGPNVWRFYIRLVRGQRLDNLKAQLEDIGREMRRSGLIVTPVPNSDEICLDIPRTQRGRVLLKDVLTLAEVASSPEIMLIPIGMTPEGQHVVRDLGKMPHLLVGGTTGSGKTVFLYGVLVMLLRSHPNPESLSIFLSTSKPEDFVFFDGLRHLEGGRVIDDASEAVELLQTRINDEFRRRGQLLVAARARDIGDYNARSANKLAPLVIMVDEFADLSDQFAGNKSARNAFYTVIRRIAQLGRNRGIHLVLCTQRPSADLVPTNIRNLMNAQVALRVNDYSASRMILGEDGAEQLQWHGDLLFKEHGVAIRAQGYFVDTHGQPNELDELIRAIRLS